MTTPVSPGAVFDLLTHTLYQMQIQTQDDSSKRQLTQDTRTASDASFRTSASDLVSADLNARLQNIGSRIRRSVSEGYATHRFSPTSMQTQTARSTSINDLPTPIFRSSNDTLHAVYSQFPSSTLAPSDRKRSRMESSVDECEEYPDGVGQVNMGCDTVMQSTSSIAANDLALSRPVKPLRRTPRTFGMTKSLPATVFGSSGWEEDQATFSAGLQEEEDWSTAAFSGDASQTQSLG
ncbi:hypothetical protein BJV78DRAFT_1279852 [Lactifluus subvellereus]|nr:hypothetical protein BJV78DRAFT_1279852 [Lactifluus subvellereus]